VNTAMWRAIAGLNTAAVVDWTGENLFRCDPYLVWADAVTPKRPADQDDKLEIAVLVELTPADTFEDFLQRMDGEALRFLPNGFEPVPASLFVTGLVNSLGLAALIAEVLARRIERFSLQASREDIAATILELASNTILFQDQDLPSRSTLHSPPEPGERPKRRRTGTYLGIVDDGLPVLKVRSSVRPILDPPAHLWDQGWQPAQLAGSEIKPSDPCQQPDPYWECPWESIDMSDAAGKPIHQPFTWRGFLYGRRLKPLPTTNAVAPNDRDEYAETGYFTPAPRQTHGARVLGLMAPWLSTARGPAEWPRHISGLAMVQLPTTTVLDTSGGSLAMRVLDGLRYILWQEERDREDPRRARPIVANVSYGTNAGPHDGTSMFERALGEMLHNHKNLRVVLPGGNAAQAGCHARRVLSAKGSPKDSGTMALQVQPDNGRDTFVEIWIPRGAKVAVRIRPPGSEEVFEILEGEAKIHFLPDRHDPNTPHRVHFGAVYARRVAQSTKGSMVLLAIGSTRHILRSDTGGFRALNQQPRREVLGMPGLWELTVHNLASRKVTVDAWVERDGAPPDMPGGSRQAFFPDSCREEVRLGNASPTDTLNGIASLRHRRLHVIGAMRADGPLSDYSAAGPARAPSLRKYPDIVAPADWSGNVAGLRTMGFVKGVITRINGTSAACAVYARALAAKLGEGPKSKTRKVPKTTPEITCVTDRQPQADPKWRGRDRRRLLPFEIDL